MPPLLPDDLAIARRLAVALLVGLVVGIEREWSGDRDGERPRFAGLRTFALYGLAGGLAGLLGVGGWPVAGAVLLAGGIALTVTAYRDSLRRPAAAAPDPGATTEIAAVVVLGLGLLAGIGRLGLAAGVAVLVALALGEKARLHGIVRHLDARELRTGLQFAVLALVVLPLLPTGPYGPGDAIRPRALWTLVLVLLALDLAGWLARRVVGTSRGDAVTGMLGGLVSSTAVTLAFSRRSRTEPAAAASLALGVVGACTVLLPRVAAIATLVAPAVARPLAAYLLPPFVVGLALVATAFRRGAHAGTAVPDGDGRSPLRLVPALQMTVAFQLALLAVPFVAARTGGAGVLATAAVLGLTDVDALTVAMSRLGLAADGPALAAQAIAVGILANTVLKLGLVLALGGAAFKVRAGAALGALGAASGVGLWVGAAMR